ncbi:embryonic protein UVS.2-like [Pleurodeles waltl]|uniref:embryonic protein UVS.2-like n=1 Tax=Pleurodeles waltl TaxID=8319 RepID=UPI0037097A19
MDLTEETLSAGDLSTAQNPKMDRRAWALIAVCLLSTCWSLPVQNVYELENNHTDHSDESKSLEVFEIIIKENEGTSQLVHEGDIAVQRDRSAKVCPKNSCFWPKSIDGTVPVPYTLSSTYSPSDVAAFNEAMLEFATLTCIRFVEGTKEADYLQISSDGGCWSYIGKAGGAQQVSLSAGCLTKGPIQHELNHALGFFHEQSRSDRDKYVTIMTENIAPEYLPNFNKENSNNLDLQYDYSSIMHYSMYAFSGNNGPTIVPKPNPNTPIGQRDGLSNLDIAKINTLYQCGIYSTLLTTQRGTVMSTNKPSSYPNNAKCMYLIRVPVYKVFLQFDAFDLQSSPNCSSDYLTIYDGNNKASPVLLRKACGTRQLPPFTSTGKEMLLEFVTDGSITANGFRASYDNVVCGYTFTSSPGTVSSPNFPNNYSNNMNCSFYIVAPDGYKVSLTFTSFDVEDDVNCYFDSLSIFNGAKLTSPLVDIYCGSKIVPTVTSTRSSLLLQFQSDTSETLKGFQATYTFVKA